MDEFFKNLYKHKGMTFGSMTETNKKAENMNKLRRETRSNMMLLRRNIKEDADEVLTPDPKSSLNKQAVQKVPNKRLEMLAKWKEEKQKRKQMEKTKKPPFKVCHVAPPVGLPNLETVNMEIKGKLFKSSQFAPPNHKFVAPSNIKPINIETRQVANHRSKEVLNKMKDLKSIGANRNTRMRNNTNNVKSALSSTELNKRSVKTPQPTVNIKQQNIAIKQSSSVTNKNTFSKPRNRNGQYNTDNGENKNIKPVVLLNDIQDTKNSVQNSMKNTKQKSRINSQSSTPHRRNLQNENLSNVKQNIFEQELSDVNGKQKKILKNEGKHLLRRQKKVSIVDLTDSPDTPNMKPMMRKTPYQPRNLKVSNPENVRGPCTFNVGETSSGETMMSDKNTANKSYCEHNLNETFEVLPSDKEGSPPEPENSSHEVYNSKLSEIIPPLASRKRNSNEIVPELTSKITPHNSKKNKSQTKPKKNSDSTPANTPRRSRRLIKEKEMSGRETNPQDKVARKNSKNGIQDDFEVPEQPKDKNSGRKIKKSSTLRRQKHIDSLEDVPSILLPHSDRSCSPDYPIEDNCDSDTSSKIAPSLYNTPIIKTPDNVNNRETSPVYISPFVTISRGKDSARKEFHSRLSQGGSLPEATDIERVPPNHTSPKAGAAYFTRILENETARIKRMCEEWENYKCAENPCESACDMINTAIGQSNLLLTKKFKQFKGLIDRCETNDQERPVTCTDLHGFWEVVYIQVSDLIKRFAYLEKLKNNNWEEIIEENKKPIPKKRGRPPKKTVAATSSLKDAIRAARNKNKKTNNNLLAVPNNDEVTFNGGFFMVRSPKHTSPSPVRKTPRRSAKKSLLSTVLTQEANRRSSARLSGIAIMKASQTAKLAESPTPSKSILKTDSNRSTVKLNKSVLFSDAVQIEGEEKVCNSENDRNSINLIHFTPEKVVTPLKRGSQRMRLTRNKLF